MMPASSAVVKNNTSRLSIAMERTGQWVFSQDIPTDIVIQVGEASFSLHKFMLVAKSNYIRKLIMESEERDLSRLNLSAIPGGPEIFEKAAKFCYNVNFEITFHNVAALRCAAEYLQMTEEFCEGNLSKRADDFLSQVALKSLPGAIAILKSCQELLPYAEDLYIVQRCVDVISLKVCNEANFPSRSPKEWWIEELTVLDVTFFEKIIGAMKKHGAKTMTIANTLIMYAERWLLNDPVQEPKSSLQSHFNSRQQRKVLESIVALLPSETEALPIHFLCCLLRCASSLEAKISCRNELEKRMSKILEHVTVDDLLLLSFSYNGERLLNLESVKRIICGFVEKEKTVRIVDISDCDFGTDKQAQYSTIMQRVAKTVDEYLAQIATYPELSISSFNNVAILVPKGARTTDDDIYRAVDIYLKAHPSLDEIEREKACSVMDPLRLSYDARVHASQNKRLPVQVVLHALYYDKLKLRSGGTGEERARRSSMTMMLGPQQRDDESVASTMTMPLGMVPKSQLQSDVELIRENEALRSELMKMKTVVSDLQKNQGGTSTATSSKKGLNRKHRFFSSMSKTLGKLNPFRHGGSKDTSNIEDADAVDLTKPRRRRFSIS